MTKTLEAGDAAPDFDLPTDKGDNIRLGDLHGKIVVLYFYPKDDTPGCTNEAKAFSEAAADFAAIGAMIVGVSKDSVASHGKFRKKYALDVRLGSAAESDVIERYGSWVQKSMYGRQYMGVDRSTFLIDRDGKISRLWRKVSVKGHVDEVLAAARDLAAK